VIADPHVRAVRLEYLTVAWNVCEVFVTVGVGIAAGSIALVAFGLDSLVEIFASAVVLWHLRVAAPDPDRSRRALRLVSYAFFALAALLIAGAIQTVAVGREAEDTPFGIAYLGVTAMVMFGLAWRKRIVARNLDNHPLVHEARITFLDGLLASGVLLALVADALLGWWWADPLAAAVVGLAAISEGREAPREHG
jgi:divalent metal cation (Fe/Co/Zn/Cd) transporter